MVLEERGVTLGTLMAFFGYLGQFYGPLQSLTALSDWLTDFLSSSQRVFDILDTPPEPKDTPESKPMPAMQGRIEFDHVTFGYDPYNPVIKNVSLMIEPGQLIGVVGKSGSGKTTLINLLCRFYDVQQGAVRIDGADIRAIHRNDLRHHIGLVLQEPFLFRASIAENIAYGRPEATPAEIMDAARAANAHDFIMRQPAGYDTQLGERGAGLSGGEKQRISIARALLCDPSVLILDEATSNVDTESEQEIQKALAVLCRGRTTIAIAHRLSTLRGADCIFVIDQGRVAESGSHEELMARQGIYHRLVMIQTQLTKLEH
jgi:ATP-binding cassette subfamily B protein